MKIFTTIFFIFNLVRFPITTAISIPTGKNAKFTGLNPPVAILVITAVTDPTHGPAIRLIKTVPIASKNNGNFRELAIKEPVKLIATATGINNVDINEKSSFKLFITIPPKFG